jgi:hypothetical protein
MNISPATLLVLLVSLAAASFGQMSPTAASTELAQLAVSPGPASSKPTLSPASAKTGDRFERLDIACENIAGSEI